VEDNSQFGRRVCDARKQLGWSQKTLGHKVHLSSNHIGALERGEKQPSLGTMRALAEGLAVPLTYLLGEVPIPKGSLDDGLTRLIQTIRNKEARSYIEGMVKIFLDHHPNDNDSEFVAEIMEQTAWMNGTERDRLIRIIEAFQPKRADP
jgi:transcriptional regulator with XRE-family HTH domain